MRVLHIHSGNLYGGIETVFITLSKLRERCPEMDPHFALCFEGRLSGELREAGTPPQILGAVRISRPPSVWRARRALRQLLRGGNFDVCVFHSAWSLAVFQSVIREAERPVIMWLHDALTLDTWLDRWAWKTSPDLVICNSHFTEGTIRARLPGIPAQTVYCPLDLPNTTNSGRSREELRGVFRVLPDCSVIIHVARLEPWKGHRLLLAALATLRDNPGWQLWEVGGAQRSAEHRYFDSLREEVGSLGLQDRVRFLGERQDIAALLAAADIYCQPNTGAEPFGIAVVEALHAGLPVVGTALGGVLEIVDPSCGYLVPPGEPQALADALLALIRSRSLRHQFGRSGRDRADALCNASRQLSRLHEALVVPAGAGALVPGSPDRMGGMTSVSSMANRGSTR